MGISRLKTYPFDMGLCPLDDNSTLSIKEDRMFVLFVYHVEISHNCTFGPYYWKALDEHVQGCTYVIL
jgi:hypothetical protein